MPKWFQNDAKFEAKMDICSYFTEKGKHSRNALFYNRKRGSCHVKVVIKSIRNRCWEKG